MSEWRVNERRRWKADAFLYDHYLPDTSRECTYCLTERQAEILCGIIQPLGWRTRWWSDIGANIDKDLIEAFRDDLIRRLMNGCCGDEQPIQYRYTGDGILQRSEDGGTTWADAPTFDPRNNSPVFPPMAGDDGDNKKCLAAAGAVALIKEQIGDQLTDDMTRYTLAQLITDWVKTMINSSNPLTALLTVIANQIFALVIAVLRPALTTGTYDTLKCIFMCRIADDGSVTEAEWDVIRSDILAQITGIAGVFFEHLIYLLGVTGTTNLLRAGGAASGDCSGCDCGGCIMRPFMTDAILGGASANIVIAGDTIEMDAVTEGDHMAATIWFRTAGDTNPAFDANKCGTVQSWTIISGTQNGQQGYSDCGTVVEHKPANPIGACMCQVQFFSSVPFRIRIVCCDCP